MNGLTNPGAAWTQGLGLWCRLWQAQIDASLTVWAAWASHLPRPDAKTLAAEAERRADPEVIRTRPIRRPNTRVIAAMARPAEVAAPQTLH
jgi:hypothetical protein